MTPTLWASALLMGLVGGPHCLAMCGGACSALASRCGGARPQRALMAWQIGRLLAYSAAGAVAASSVALLGEWGRELAWLRPWWLMLHLGALALGAWMLWHGRAPAWLSGAQRLTWPAPGPAVFESGLTWAVVDGPRPATPDASIGKLGRAAPRQAVDADVGTGHGWQAVSAGLAWIVLPCGLLHAALLTAALGSTAADGAIAMALFAIGSGASLWLGPSVWIALTRRLPASSAGRFSWQFLQGFGPVQATRLAGLLLAAGSGWAVWHAVLGPAIDAFCA